MRGRPSPCIIIGAFALRVLHFSRTRNEDKELQIRLTLSTFRGIEYLHLRKYFLSYDEEWLPTPDGIAFAIDFTNTFMLSYFFIH